MLDQAGSASEPRVDVRLRPRRDPRWAEAEVPERGRRVHPAVPADRGGAQHDGEDGGAGARGVVQVHGEPGAIRSDNGSEFTAKGVKAWLTAAGIETLYIERGSPWENGYA